MNLFSKPKTQEPATPPSIDEAQMRVESLRRGQKMSSRAAAMLSAGQGGMRPSVARRDLTGN